MEDLTAAPATPTHDGGLPPDSTHPELSLLRHLAAAGAHADADLTRAAIAQAAATLATLPPPRPSTRPVTDAIDPLTDPVGFRDQFATYGVVVADNLASSIVCAYAASRVRAMVLQLSDGSYDLADPATWTGPGPVDADGTPLLHRAFLELFHDDGLAQIRQQPALWFAHVLLWGQTRLSVTFDRLAVKLPGVFATDALPLHVDQNPNRDPGFACTQGMVALLDNPVSIGAFTAVPASRDRFADWRAPGEGLGDYVPLAPADRTGPHAQLWDSAVRFALRAGQGVFWDSRTVHASSAPDPDVTAHPALPAARGVRLVALTSMAPQVLDPQALEVRRDMVAAASGANVRAARAHASFRPRYSAAEKAAAVRAPEVLTPLGHALYFGTWDELD